MKTPKSLYSRLALITSVTLVVGYFVVYAVYENINSEEVASNATITSTLMGKIKNNLDTLNTQVTDLTATVVASSIWSKVGSDINYTAGKVGIGATTGNAELDIQSGIKPHWGIYHDSTTEELRFWNGDNRVVIGSTGNVGIGTVSPLRALHVKSAAGTAQIESTGTSGTLYFGDATSSVIDNQGIGSRGNNIAIMAGGTDKFTVLSTGNVGIGTTNPGRTLFVNGASGANGSVLVSNGFFEIDGSNPYTSTAAGTANLRIGWPTTSRVGFNLQGIEVMTMLPAGNVGIGVTAPTNPLVVDANNTATSPIVAYSTQTYDAFSILPHNGQTYLTSGIYYKNGAWVHDGTGTKNALFAFGGAGATWYASDNSAGSWNVASAVPLWSAAGVLQGVSSKASKENYESLDFRDILDRIDRLPVERWNYKTEGKGIKHIGPYAEDFRASFGLGESDKSIALIDEAGIALAGVKGLRELVREQEQTIQELRKDVEMLKKTR